MAAATLSDADTAALRDLKKKGIAACKRDHDAEAEAAFEKAIDITTNKKK